MTTSLERPATSAPDTSLDAKQWFILIVLCFTVLLISLDQTVLNVALPTLVRDLHPSNSGLEWIVDSYTLTQAVLLLLSGALGDRFGRRRMSSSAVRCSVEVRWAVRWCTRPGHWSRCAS